MKQWKYFPLTKATMVGRRHQKDIQPPSMNEITNMYVSRSDHVPSLRPDLNHNEDDWTIPSIGKSYWGTTGMTSPNTNDFVNSVHGVWGTSELVFFTRFAPYSGKTGLGLWGTYDTGTARVDAIQLESTRTKIVALDNTDDDSNGWLKNVWPGCFLKFTGGLSSSDSWWRVDEVVDDATLYVDGTATQSSYSAYIVYRTYNSEWSDYKVHVDPYTSGLIVSSPSISTPIAPRNICGPFYMKLSEGHGEYQSWSVLDTGLDYSYAGALQESGAHGQITKSGVNDWYVAAFGVVDGSGNGVVARSDSPSDEDDWEASPTSPETLVGSPFGVIYVSYDNYFHLYTTKRVTGSEYKVRWYTSIDGAHWELRQTIFDGTATSDRFRPTAPMAYGKVGTDSSAPGVLVVFDPSSLSGVNCLLQKVDGQPWSSIGDRFLSLPTGGTGSPQILDWAAGPLGSSPTSAYVIMFCGTCTVSDVGTGTVSTMSVTSNSNLPTNTIGTSATLRGVATDGSGTWVVVGDDQSDSGVYAWRGSIGSWTRSVVTEDAGRASGLTWNGKYFLVAIGNQIYYSNDGNGWSPWSGEDWGTAGPAIYADEDIILARHRESDDTDADNYDLIYGDWTAATDPGWSLGEMTPLSDLYRASCFAVLHGQVVLFGTSEYNAKGDFWEHHPRRTRWSSPGTYGNFSAAGSGTGDSMGSGVFLDARAVGGRILVFESNQISTMSKRGYVNDPFEYDILARGTRLLSNPVVVDETCYWISEDGLLCASNGIDIAAPIDGMPFDLTEYDDFDTTKPVYLSYSTGMRSLICYRYDSDESKAHYMYLISLDSGSVSRWELPRINDADATPAVWLQPLCATGIEDSSDTKTIVSWNPYTTREAITIASFSEGDAITGVDEFNETAAMDERFHGVLETGEIWLAPEGQKVILQDVIIKTHVDSDASTVPRCVVEVQSTEDDFSTWYGVSDDEGSIEVGDGTAGNLCDGTNTVWSNKWDVAWLDGTAQTVDTTPWLATGVRAFQKKGLADATELTTTVTDTNEIQVTGTDTYDLYLYYEGYPEVSVAVSDYIKTTTADSGATVTRLHRISGITDRNSITFPTGEYMPSGDTSVTAVHRKSNTFAAAISGEITAGVNRLVQGVKIRIYAMPISVTGDASIVKITGITLGYTVAGDKKAE